MTSATDRGIRSAAGRWYSSFAKHACTAVLLLVVVNVIMAGALALRDEQDRHQLPSALRAIKQRHGPASMSLLYPGWDDRAVASLYEEWNRLTNQYDPFTQFKLRPATGSYINVSEHGFRLNGYSAQWPPDGTMFNIFVFGGSTTFGAGLPDNQTIPAALEAILRGQSCAAMARVYNFARPGYVSVQERLLFEQLLLSGAIPHIALFVDGLNDSVWRGLDPPYTAALSRMMDLVNTSSPLWLSYEWARELVISLPMARVAELIKARFNRPPRQEERVRSATASADVPVEERVNRWIANKQLAEAGAQPFEVKALFVAQPVPTYNYDLTYHLFADHLRQWGSPDSRVARQSTAFYDLMNKRRDDASVSRNLLWLADVQRGRRENFYVDSLHYTAAFSKEIALAISDDMSRRGWLPCAPGGAG